MKIGDGPALAEIGAVNAALAPYGAGVWPLALGRAPPDIRALLARPTLTADESERIEAAFLLSRETLLDTLARAGRAPHVAGGGALESAVANHGYAYPQLFVVEAGADYSRFDRFHVNVADDGTAVDEVMQILAGGGVRILQRLPGGEPAILTLDCPVSDWGWTVTYDGAVSHIGSMSAARPGTKALMQVFGPARWTMRYDAG
ncbi:MAG: hypothetical protein OXP07_10015 [Defluviicoccus sp.]|nr:hypothetical protein [Defluviicoccus sp.]